MSFKNTDKFKDDGNQPGGVATEYRNYLRASESQSSPPKKNNIIFTFYFIHTYCLSEIQIQ